MVPARQRRQISGIAGGKGEGLLIMHGEVVKKLPEEELLPALKDALDHWEEQ